MPQHLIKLCVGVESVEELIDWQRRRLADMERLGVEVLLRHTTRQSPRRREDILAGGSLYWVIKGEIACRQAILDLRSAIDDEGVERCDICLAPETVKVEPRPRGPFQGWRYLAAEDAPPDLQHDSSTPGALPESMRRELRNLGVV